MSVVVISWLVTGVVAAILDNTFSVIDAVSVVTVVVVSSSFVVVVVVVVVVVDIKVPPRRRMVQTQSVEIDTLACISIKVSPHKTPHKSLFPTRSRYANLGYIFITLDVITSKLLLARSM